VIYRSQFRICHRLVPEAFVILDPPNDSARVFAAAEIVEKPLAEP